MLSFSEFLIEIEYKNKNELHTDSKLVFMAFKHHLRNPENFKKFIKNKTDNSETNRFASAFNHSITHHVNINDMDIHPDLKQKYSGMDIFAGPRLGGLMNITRNVAGSSSQLETKNPGFLRRMFGAKPTHHVDFGLYNMKSLHPENIKNKSMEDTYNDFHKELNSRYDTFAHEFTHASDQLKSGKPINADYNNITDKEIMHRAYYNHPAEVRAFSHQLDYHLQKAKIEHPEYMKRKPSDGTKETLRKLDAKYNHNYESMYEYSSPTNKSNIDDLVKSHNLPIDDHQEKMDRAKSKLDDLLKTSKKASQERYRRRKKLGISLKKPETKTKKSKK